MHPIQPDARASLVASLPRPRGVRVGRPRNPGRPATRSLLGADVAALTNALHAVLELEHVLREVSLTRAYDAPLAVSLREFGRLTGVSKRALHHYVNLLHDPLPVILLEPVPRKATGEVTRVPRRRRDSGKFRVILADGMQWLRRRERRGPSELARVRQELGWDQPARVTPIPARPKVS